MSKNKKKLKSQSNAFAGIFDDLIDPNAKPAPITTEPLPKPREVIRGVFMFWREEKCDKCHRIYEGSLYDSAPMLQLEMQTPIIHFGRFYGWRYKGVKFQPITAAACYDHLPHQVQVIKTTVRKCPRCVHIPNIIYLPQEVTAC